jgi:hypothetical protein
VALLQHDCPSRKPPFSVVGTFVGIVVAVFLYCIMVKKGICHSADGDSSYGGTMSTCDE